MVIFFGVTLPLRFSRVVKSMVTWDLPDRKKLKVRKLVTKLEVKSLVIFCYTYTYKKLRIKCKRNKKTK